MGMWSKLALLAAGALVGGAATRVASDPAARRFGEFTARVRAGMEEREAQLQQQFGVRSPVDHTANHPAAPDDAVPPAGVPWHPVTSHDSSTDPEDPRARVIEHTPSEGNER